MKKTTFLFSLFLFFISASPTFAFTAFCNQEVDSNSSFHAGVHDDTELECLIGEKDGYAPATIRIAINGVVAQVHALEGSMVTCPLVTRNRLAKMVSKNGSWSTAGVGASANWLLGARVGVSVNYRGAFCFIAGISFLNMGVAAGEMTLTVTEYSRDSRVQFQD